MKIDADRRITVDTELLDGHCAAPELHPECRLVAQRIGPKTAADAVLGMLSHVSFLGLGVLGTGLLFVCSAVVVRDFEQRITTESLVVDVRRVTVPIIEPPQPAVSSQPRASDKPVSKRTPPDSAIRPQPAVPAPPMDVHITAIKLVPQVVCVNDHCAGDTAPSQHVP